MPDSPSLSRRGAASPSKPPPPADADAGAFGEHHKNFAAEVASQLSASLAASLKVAATVHDEEDAVFLYRCTVSPSRRR